MRIRRSAILCLVCTLPELAAQTEKIPAGDWPRFNRDLAGTRFSPLTQIGTKNVSKLVPVWSYRLQPAGFRFATASGTSELTPIVVGGVMYISAQT
ncbi:MAG TPA: hypothetical protein VH640_18855, partial [Bryobacteraceae bacterium]